MALADGVYERATDYDLCASDRDLLFDIKNATHAAVISEIKFASPSEGKLRTVSDPAHIATQMINGGAKGLSVLTQPHLFGGSPEYFAKVRQAVDVPLLMKDIIIDTQQIDAASCIGADYILLIQSVFQSGLLVAVCDANNGDLSDTIHNDTTHNDTTHNDTTRVNMPHRNLTGDTNYTRTLDDLISYAHKKDLGVLLEVHTIQEYMSALHTDADIIGINNRNLDTLVIDVGVTCDILSEYDTYCSNDDHLNDHNNNNNNNNNDHDINHTNNNNNNHNTNHNRSSSNNNNNNHNNNDHTDHKIIISESGISSPDTIRKLRDCGADGFLIGSSIMKSNNIQRAVNTMVNSY